MELAGLEPEWFECDGAEFKLRPLTGAEQFKLGVLIAKENDNAFEFAFNTALTDWRRISFDGNDVQFTDKNKARIHYGVFGKIAKRVIQTNLLGAAAEKN